MKQLCLANQYRVIVLHTAVVVIKTRDLVLQPIGLVIQITVIVIDQSANCYKQSPFKN